jgi:hypothetical protein
MRQPLPLDRSFVHLKTKRKASVQFQNNLIRADLDHEEVSHPKTTTMKHDGKSSRLTSS